MNVFGRCERVYTAGENGDNRRDGDSAVARRMRNRDEESARRVERVSGILVGACGVLIVSVAFGVSFVAGFEYFRPSTLVVAGFLAALLLGGAVGAYTHSQSNDRVGFVLLWFPLPFVFISMFSAVGLYLLPVLVLVFAMTGSASIVEEHRRQRR